MRINLATIPIVALAIAFGSVSVEGAQRGRGSAAGGEKRGERRSRGIQAQGQARQRAEAPAQQRGTQTNRGGGSTARDAQRGERRNSGIQAQGQARQRADAPAQPRGTQANRGGAYVDRGAQRNQGVAGRSQRGNSRDSRDIGRSGSFSTPRGNDRGRPLDRRGSYGYYAPRGNDRGRSLDRRGSYGYYAPRILPRRSAPRRYYGSGGHLSLYFGIGSGYRYGSLYSGRVYGYRGRVAGYGAYQYYGDVRLLVSPRDAAVYVDGYYAGIVDDFDGFFQRLTLEVGPHEIEIEAPGLDSQVFDVYVDSSRTVDLRADLLR